MKWFVDFLSSTLGRKLLMALTGIFLILFLIIHLLGNLQLLKCDGGESFNHYANFMSHNPLVQIISKVNFAIIIAHALVALCLTLYNRKARGTDSYVVKNTKSSAWASRNMGILGTILLVFIVIHLKDFWAVMHYGDLPKTDDGGENLYSLVTDWFKVEWYVALYVACMGAVSFHLWHGFASAFQTLGFNHLKYNCLINFAGKAFSIAVPALYALIPVMMYFQNGCCHK